MAQFKIYIQTRFEERLSAMNNLGYEGPDDPDNPRRIKVAQMTFAFYNEAIIN